MTSASALRPEVGFVTFGALRLDSPETATELVKILTIEVREWVRHTAGFVSSRIHVSLDGTTVVSRGQWVSDADFRNFTQSGPGGSVLRGLLSRPGVLGVATFGGAEAAGIEGPAAAEPTGIVAVATRRVGGHDSARAVGDLLVQSGEWKRHFPGFVAATAYISPDGKTYGVYTQWVDEAAYQSYMADPRIAEGQKEIARFEVALPKFVLCRVVADIEAS